MYCKKCGTENLNEAKFCKNCGAELTRNIQKKPEQVQNPVKKSRVGLIVAVVIILAAIAGGGLFVMKYIEEKRIEKNAEDYRKYMSDADKYLEELDYKKAEDSYLKAIEISPKEKEPYLKLADVYVAQEEYDKAVDILEQAEKAVEDNTSEISEKKEEIEKREEYTWVVEPTIEADDIYYVKEEDSHIYTRNGLRQQFQSPYAVIKQGEALGLIDMDGNLKMDLEYERIYKVGCLGNENYILKRIKPKYSEEIEGEQYYYYLWKDGTLGEVRNWGDVGGECGSFYWHEGLHNVIEDTDFLEYNSIPKSAIPVKNSEEIYDIRKMLSPLEWYNNLNSLYAVCKNGKLITDFEYDECGASSEGLLAISKNGKWGYINENGKLVIPIEYDPSWLEYAERKVDGEGALQDYCYAASYGYVNLCKDNKWELRDTKGNLVILPGIFERILPVYEGKCWVKKEGKWGVIQIGKPKNTVNTEVSKEDLKQREDSEEEEKVSESSLKEIESEKITELENQAKVLEEKLQDAMTQRDMNSYSRQIYELWDNEINDLWAILKENLSQSEMEALTVEQRNWIQYKEEQIKLAGSEAEGGSMQPMLESDCGADLTKKRVMELIEKLP